jgi:hypothetical protein
MNSQQLMDEVYENYSEWLEMEKDNIVMVQILTGLLLREREKNEVLTMKLKRLELVCST